MCELYCLNQVWNTCIVLEIPKTLISIFKFYPENPFQNRSTFWGWVLKQSCRACRVVQSLFLEFFKLFSKIWSYLKRRNSLNIPVLNSKVHFKMYAEFGYGFKSKVVELLILNNFCFLRFLSCYENLGVIWEFWRMAIL